MPVRKMHFTLGELSSLAASCKTIEELLEVAERLNELWELGANINLEYFRQAAKIVYNHLVNQ